MALKMTKSGQYQVRTQAEAVEALKTMVELQESIEELMQEHGISEMMQDAAEMKKAATAYAAKNKLERIDVDKETHFTLISQHYDARFIGTAEDLTPDLNADHPVMPLRTIIYRKFKSDKARAKEVWMQVSKRVAVKEKIDDAVAGGILTVDEIAPSFVEKTKAPYLRKFNS